MEISISKIKKGDLLETMRFCYCADKESFVSAFNKIGLPINSEDDLITLNQWHKDGLDTTGKIKLKNGNIITFDIDRFVKNNIKLNHNSVLNCKFTKIN